MAKNKEWLWSEKKILKENYTTKTIKELEELLPSRSKDSINCQIKRLKQDGKIETTKSKEAINRAYLQREKLTKD